MEFLFWFCLCSLLVVYAVYPGLMALLARVPDVTPGEGTVPTVTVAIAAYNEAEVIADKLRSCLNQDYPGRLEVVLVSDGSSDATVERARGIRDARIEIVDLQENVGKASALNAALARANGDVVVLTDARQPLDTEAVAYLVSHFHDASVGAVSGDLRYDRELESGLQRALHRYWDYEKRIRLGEARLHSCVGATGALYAIRRSLWEDLPAGLLLDDVYTPMRIVLDGYRVRFDPRAWAVDVASEQDDDEYHRRVRTLTGNYQLLFELPALLNPLRNPIWLQYGLHKLGRLVSPLLLLGLLVGAAFSDGSVYELAFVLQAGFWVAALLMMASRSTMRFARPLALPYAFAMAQGAAVQAFVHCLRREWRVWKKSVKGVGR